MIKKTMWIAGVIVVSVALIVGIVRYIEAQKQEKNPNW